MTHLINTGTVAMIRPEYLRDEPSLLGTKWLDYRYLSAIEATAQFAREYLFVYREQAKFFSATASRSFSSLSPISEQLFANSSRILNALWRARQIADQIGTPYDFYIWRAFRYCEERFTKRPPAPNQLYSDKIWTYVLTQWTEWEAANGLLAGGLTDVRFLACNYRGEPPQDAHHDRIIANLRNRTGSDLRDALRRHIHDRAWLTEERAIREFGAEVVAAASSDGRVLSRPAGKAPLPYRPSCFGLLHALDVVKDSCLQCPFQVSCGESACETLGLVREVHGSEHPRLDHKRMMDRERQRRHRRKKRTAASVPERIFVKR